MIKFTDECVGCPPERGCLGASCPTRSIETYVCDECGCEADELYQRGRRELCEDCFLELTREQNICDKCGHLIDGYIYTMYGLKYCEECILDKYRIRC